MDRSASPLQGSILAAFTNPILGFYVPNQEIR